MASVVCTLVCVPPILWRSSTLGILLVVLTQWRWAFSLLSVQSSLFSCRQEVHKNSTFLFLNCNHESFSRCHTFEFWMSYHTFPLMLLTFWFTKWSQVSLFIAVYYQKPACPLSYSHITSDWFPCFFVFIWEHCWCSLSTDLGITKLFIGCHYTLSSDL
jgi:hypothetical protein